LEKDKNESIKKLKTYLQVKDEPMYKKTRKIGKSTSPRIPISRKRNYQALKREFKKLEELN